VAGGVDPPLVQHDELAGDLLVALLTRDLALPHSEPPEAVEGGRLAAGVVAHGVDLVDGTYSLSPPRYSRSR
jgi:hypothetical protein